MCTYGCPKQRERLCVYTARANATISDILRTDSCMKTANKNTINLKLEVPKYMCTINKEHTTSKQIANTVTVLSLFYRITT